MPDDLYETDILAWSRAQAERLRRVAAGERVNDVDWENVIEEVEDVGKGQLNGVLAHLELAMVHALKVLAWPGHTSVGHWTGEITNFLTQARTRFQPGMRKDVDPAAIYADALQGVRAMPMPGAPDALPLPEGVAFTVEELRDRAFGARALLDRIAAAQAPLLGGGADA